MSNTDNHYNKLSTGSRVHVTGTDPNECGGTVIDMLGGGSFVTIDWDNGDEFGDKVSEQGKFELSLIWHSEEELVG